MIRFIRLLFYHIYIYYYKADNGNKSLAKFSTFLVFTVIISIIIYFGYSLSRSSLDDTFISRSNYFIYISIISIVSIFVGINIYSKKFENSFSFKDYDTKYYFYFFIIAGFSLALAFYAGNINRKRIFDNRVKEHEKVGNIDIPNSSLNIL